MIHLVPRLKRAVPVLPFCFLLAACGQDAPTAANNEPEPGESGESTCSIPEDQIFQGQRRDGIPALTNPPMVSADQDSYLEADSRVVGLVWDSVAIAIPHAILWWHEIVNLDLDGGRIAVTYCPLTGSSIVFDRAAVGGAEFGVSGLLFETNLIMYNRSNPESLWPQMARGARCGEASGTALPTIASLEMTWKGWKTLHPETQVVSEQTGRTRNYRVYPYGAYEVVDNSNLLFPISRDDDRRQPKERVLGIPGSRGSGLAFPFRELDRDARNRVVSVLVNGVELVVFWDSQSQAAAAYHADINGVAEAFEVREGKFVDVATGSTWSIGGRALSGGHKNTRLSPVTDAFVAFWFAWAVFQPQTEVWAL